MKVYKVVDGDIKSIDILKETKCFYYISNSIWFLGASRIEKKWACTTKKEAVQEYLNRQLESVGLFIDKLDAAKIGLAKARELMRSILEDEDERRNNRSAR